MQCAVLSLLASPRIRIRHHVSQLRDSRFVLFLSTFWDGVQVQPLKPAVCGSLCDTRFARYGYAGCRCRPCTCGGAMIWDMGFC